MGVFKEPEKPRVLVIEDDRTVRRMIRASVKEDCNLVVAGNANLGMSLFRNIQPHIIFLDIMLPDSNGHELLSAMMSANSDAFIVMMSGLSDNDNVFRAVETGAKGFISKPFNEDKMRFFIEKSVQHKH
ncbi:response regulator [Alphaproteobacteria bacterium]|nr:response regulator [Alphaproteobacteria bacterium]